MPSTPLPNWEVRKGVPQPAAGATPRPSAGQAPTDPSTRVSGPQLTDPSKRVSGG